MATITIPVLRVKQNSHVFYLSRMNAEDVKTYTKVDRFRSDLPNEHPLQGYQRAEEPGRYKKFANYLIKEEHPLCPTALLLSARDCDLRFDAERSTIVLDSEQKVQIVDGQHRAAGYRFAIFEKTVENLIGFEVPVIIVPAMSKIKEMTQFAVINGTQKGVRLDLVNMILAQVHEKAEEGEFHEKELPRVIIARAVEALSTEPDSPWHDLIIMPNQKAYTKREIAENPKLGNLRIIRATSFMTALKQVFPYLYQHDGFLPGNAKEQAKRLAGIIKEYWNAIEALVPEAFAEPSKYVIQKSAGVFALHIICKRIMPRMYVARRPWVKDEFQYMLEKSERLSDPGSWLADGGEFSKYGGMKGFTEIADIIDQQLRA